MDLQLQVDVTEAAGLGEAAHVALTVTVPDVVGIARCGLSGEGGFLPSPTGGLT